MEAQITIPEVVVNATVTFTLPLNDLKQIVEGLGNTSIYSRKQAGMTEEQAELVGSLFFALSDALDGQQQNLMSTTMRSTLVL